MSIINILHLSDLHYSAKKDSHNQEIVLTALKNDLVKLCEGSYKPDFVIFSGDLVGQIFTMLILTVAAAEAAIGLAIIVIFFRAKGTIRVEDIHGMKG